MTCDCIKFIVTPSLGDPFEIELSSGGFYGGAPFFELPFEGDTLFIYSAGECLWVLATALGNPALAELTNCDCPLGVWSIITPKLISLESVECDNPFQDCCFQALHWVSKNEVQEMNFTYASRTGIYNNAPYWNWSANVGVNTYHFSLFLFIFPNGQCQWQITEIANIADPPISGTLDAYIDSECECPRGTFTTTGVRSYGFITASCRLKCIPLQDRIYRVYEAIKMPYPFEEQDRGWRDCCDCPMLVLAGGDTDTWKNDVTSAWIKLSDPSDTVNFILTKDGLPTTYVCPIYSFPNEEDAYYTTIKWRDVLSSDGAGCYKLEIEYNISGLTGLLGWGIYNLKPYTIQNALKTARIRVKFNLNQEIEGINFTDANVEDCIRFYGFIGDRQPNTEIDNLIYQDRKVKSVVRENLDTYIITTDPLKECFIRPLTDLYLLSENEMYISDYNVHNHSYRILDTPVILEESPEIDYLDRWQRRAILTAKVGIKSKNRRTHY